MASFTLWLPLSRISPTKTLMSSQFSPSTSSTTRPLSPVPPPPCLLGFRRIYSPVLTRRSRRSLVVGMAPEEEKMTRRSPLDFPIEWDRPKPGRRPDVFPQFSPMKTPMPQPMPADPPDEDEEEEEEEEKRKEEEEEEDPDKENPDKPDMPS